MTAPHAPTPPRRRASNGGLFALLGVGGCALFGVLVAGVTVVVLIMVAGVIKAANDIPVETPTAAASSTRKPAPKTYTDTDSKYYKQYLGELSRMETTYLPKIQDGSIYDLLPQGEAAGEEYVRTFQAALAEYRNASMFGGADSTDLAEVDDRVQADILKLKGLEKRFLKGEDLQFSYRIGHPDGTSTTGSGKPKSTEPAPKKKATTLQEVWKKVAAVKTEKDADGRYIGAGERIAKAAGVTISYSAEGLGDYCPGTRGKGETVGWYCTAIPEVIWIPGEDKSIYPAYYRDPRYVDTVRHELAHHMIDRICGTTAPPITGDDRYEAATNSFAVLFLGGSRDRLDDVLDKDRARYKTDQASDDAARSIAEGRCQ